MAPANTPLLTHSNVSATSVDLSRIYYHEKSSGKHQVRRQNVALAEPRAREGDRSPVTVTTGPIAWRHPWARTRQPTLGTDSGSAIQPLGT